MDYSIQIDPIIFFKGSQLRIFKIMMIPEDCFCQKHEPVHEISNNVVCATSKASDQPAHTRSLIRAFASRLSIL